MRKNDVVTLARQAAANITNAMAQLKELQREITANGGASWIDGDALAGHTGITQEEVVAVVYTTHDAIDGLLTANGNAHAGNLYRLL